MEEKEKKKKGGRPLKEELPVVRTNLTLTEHGMDMLKEIMDTLGFTSRSEAMRHCIAEEYKHIRSIRQEE